MTSLTLLTEWDFIASSAESEGLFSRSRSIEEVFNMILLSNDTVYFNCFSAHTLTAILPVGETTFRVSEDHPEIVTDNREMIDNNLL